MSPFAAVPTASFLAAAALLVAACGSPPAGPGRQMTFPTSSASPTATTGSATATATPPVARPVPRIPPAREPVTGRGLVLQRSHGQPQLCLGPVALSFPPGCQGVPLVGWDWSTAGPHDEDKVDGGVTRSGSYAVTGRFDGRALTVTGSVPLRPGDNDAEPTPRPSAPPPLDAAQWDGVFRALAVAPGLITLGPAGDSGPMLLTVVHDDGTIQAWVDASFGAGVVVVTSELR